MVQEKKIFKGFYHIWAWRPSWSCDLDHLYKYFVPPSQGGSTENLALIGQAVSEEKMFENVDGRTPDPWVYYKLNGEPSAQVS